MSTVEIATSIAQRLHDAGHIAYFAGGWVRDFIMHTPSDDIDIATSASVSQVQALFSKTVPVGIAFGIVIVVEKGHPFEVATFRKERGYVDGRRPTSIESATPQEDSQRRDFTINGIFYDPLRQEILDFVRGEHDIANKLIRAIGNPHERFLEDRLRMMRAVRYSTRFSFSIEEATLQAIRTHASTLLPSVAMERIWQEFKKMSRFAHFDAGLVLLHELGLLPTIFPVLRGVSTEEVTARTKAISFFPSDAPAIAELLELFPGATLAEITSLCNYLKLSSEESDFAEFLHHTQNMLDMPQDWLDALERIEWAKFYAQPHSSIALQIIAAHHTLQARELFLKEHQKRRQRLEQAILRLQAQTPLVRAEHLLQEGIAPGKKLGLLLKEAERIAVNQELQDPIAVIRQLKKLPLWKS